MIYQDIVVTKPESMSNKEAAYYIDQEFESMQQELSKIASIEISLDGDEVVLQAKKKSNITRIRRITGYMSKVNNFNDSKRAELNDRVSHM